MMRSEPDRPTFEPSDSPMDILVKLSRYYGGNPDFVVAGGGNTSMKTDEALYVKASGLSLGAIDAGGFVALDRKSLFELVEQDLGKDPIVREGRFKGAVLGARLDKEECLRPSVESILHNFVAARFVVHLHPTHVNGLTCCQRGQRLARELFGDDVLWISYVEPGFRLGQAFVSALAEYRQRAGRDFPEAVLLQNHGLVVAGDTPEVILERTDRVVAKIRERLDATSSESVFGEVTRVEPSRAGGLIEVIGPALRALLAEGEGLKVVTFDDSATVLSLAGAPEGRALAGLGPMTPDQIVYSGPVPLWFEPPAEDAAETIVGQLREEITRHARAAKFPPRVVLVKGLGMFAAGDHFKAADTAHQMYAGAIQVMAYAKRLGGIHPMTDEQRQFIEEWEPETYRRSVLLGTRPGGRVTGKVAVVTGAAQGFGLEISRELAAQGAHVVLADINAEGAVGAAGEICDRFGKGKALGLAMDVAEAQAIAQAMHQVVRTYGGCDLLICNAGVLRADSVKTQPESEFDFVTSVNFKGYFLCVQKAARILAIQHLARPTYRSDIIQINSKSGLVGSSRNAAYAGSKFGGIGLTQSFALELVEDGIKVNAICPGNYFDGPLWSDPQDGLFVQYLRAGKVPGAKTIEDVRRAYEAKVPMGRGCTTADVMAVLYYLIEQQYETGQAIPVTGGQVMLK